MNRNYWDDPFGRNTVLDPRDNEYKWANVSEAGVIVPRNSPDIDKIHADHLRLAPVFQALHDAASRILDRLHSSATELVKTHVLGRFDYRRPDPPYLVQTLIADIDGHGIVLMEPTQRTFHPVVESVCPAKPFSALSKKERMALHEIIPADAVTLRMADNPPYVRYVNPAVVGQILNWFHQIEGTIYDVEFSDSTPRNNLLMRIVSALKSSGSEKTIYDAEFPNGASRVNLLTRAPSAFNIN